MAELLRVKLGNSEAKAVSEADKVAVRLCEIEEEVDDDAELVADDFSVLDSVGEVDGDGDAVPDALHAEDAVRDGSGVADIDDDADLVTEPDADAVRDVEADRLGRDEGVDARVGL